MATQHALVTGATSGIGRAIAEVAAFLVGEAGSYVDGSVIVANGGEHNAISA
jgi:NADP-dependent 3-hydroxy acid dehydrogenase YdfG